MISYDTLITTKIAMQKHRIIFIGGGNIAEAMFAKEDNNEVIVIEHNESRLVYLVHTYPQITIKQSLDFISTINDLVVIAVKPQNAHDTCLALKDRIHNSTILSVMAGITVASLKKWLNTDNIIRAMPNTPGIQNIGVTGIYFSSTITNSIKILVNTLFTTLGLTYIFALEDDINKITAVTSSAPAYVFYFLESLIESATQNFNFSEKDAKAMTIQVLKGSLSMLEKNPDLSITTLRNNVTSKGGTTAAAIHTLAENNFKEIINKAEIACYNRAIEIGNSYK